MRILVLQPIRHTNPPALRERADVLMERMVAANPTLDVAQAVQRVSVRHPSRYAPHAAARNAMLNTYLKPEHTHVLWIDSDLIEYPAELPALLMDAGADIVAPFPILDKWRTRFYDIGGFIENGNRARLWPPYFEQDGDVIELDCVGCCYLIPASLYHAGVRYAPPPNDYYVEHWSVMQAAKRRGMRIVALPNVRVIHAWLPDYGLEEN